MAIKNSHMRQISSLTVQDDADVLIHLYNDIHNKMIAWILSRNGPKKRYANSRRAYVIDSIWIQQLLQQKTIHEGFEIFKRIMADLMDYNHNLPWEDSLIEPMRSFKKQLVELFVKQRKGHEEQRDLFLFLRGRAASFKSNPRWLPDFYETVGFETVAYYLDEIEISLLHNKNRMLFTSKGEFMFVEIEKGLSLIDFFLTIDLQIIDGHISDPIMLIFQDTVIKKYTYCKILIEKCNQKYLS